MGVNSYDDLIRHVGHKVEVVTYGQGDDIRNVACECEDCNEVLIDFDRHEDSDSFVEQLSRRISKERMLELTELLMSDEREEILSLYDDYNFKCDHDFIPENNDGKHKCRFCGEDEE